MQTIQTHPYDENKVLDTYYDADKKIYTPEKPPKRKGLKQRLTKLFKPLKA